MPEYEKILRRLAVLHPKQIDLSLGRINKLLTKLGNPESKLPPTIHVAGTNGKGSTIAFLRSIFEKNFFNVHVYTSPHLINFNERIRMNSKLISNESLINLLEECEFYNQNNPITFFEITTCAAYLGFSRVQADVLLLETGLGGKFDATNVVKDKICSVLTPISLDHMSFLGNSIKLITKEKVGIFKKNIPAVISQQLPEALKIIKNESIKKNIDLFQYGSDWKILNKKNNHFKIKIFNKNYEVPTPKLFGEHQLYNSGLALAVSKTIKGFKFKDENSFKGIYETFWPARMQKINKGKLKTISGRKFELWLDGGHNSHASEMLLQNLKKWKKNNLFLIFGMIKGKEPEDFLNKLLPYFRSIQVIPIKEHEFINSKNIKDIFKNFSLNIRSEPNIVEALKFLKNNYTDGKIIICGSLYLAGDILKSNGSQIT